MSIRTPLPFLLLLGVCIRGADAQVSRLQVAAGWDLDTTALGLSGADSASLRNVWSLWRDYLYARISGEDRSNLWLAAERTKWPEYDLTAFQAYQSFEHTGVTVLSIRPPNAAVRDTMIIRTLFTRITADSLSTLPQVRPVALTRIYAVNTPLGWRLSNTLTNVTAGWARVHEGSITFLYSPTARPDRDRRQAANRFVDSLARIFQVTPPRDVLYLVASSGEEAYRAVGFDYAVIGSFTAGKTYVANKLLLAGDARVGEAYLHELAHLVFAGIAHPDSVPYLINEGLAVWVGGTLGQSYPLVRAEYARLLQRQPEITLDMVVEGSARGDMRPGGALLCEMIFEAGGAAAIRAFLAHLRQVDIRRAVELATGQPWASFAAQWRVKAKTGAA